MKINVKTKFNIGDKVYREEFGTIVPLTILGVELHVNGSGEIEVFYVFKMFSDRPTTDIIREDMVFVNARKAGHTSVETTLKYAEEHSNKQ